MNWRKSSHTVGDCVEVLTDGKNVYFRDSKNPSRRVKCTREEYEEFLEGVKAGEFDLECE